jgi:hypothetical protein
MTKALRYQFRSALPGYGVAGVSTALATLAQFPLRPLVGSQHPYSFYYVAVMVTAWYAGLRRALLALTLGALSANYFFLPPENTLAITGTANRIGLALYLLVALVGTLLIEALRQPRPAGEPPAHPLLTRRPALWAGAGAAPSHALAEQLAKARVELARAQQEVGCQRAEIDRLQERLRRPAPGAETPRLPIHGTDSVMLLRVTEIDCVERRGHQLLVRTGKGEYQTDYTFTDLESLLPSALFVRVHEDFLVNLDRILDLVLPDGESHVIRLTDGQRLPVEHARCPELRRRLGLQDGLWE